MPDAICFVLQTLDSILNVEMVKEKSAEEIKQVMDLNGMEFAPHLCLIMILSTHVCMCVYICTYIYEVTYHVFDRSERITAATDSSYLMWSCLGGINKPL